MKCGAAREVVSIQPKPKKGLVAEFTKYADFRKIRVSIQPKPKKGLVDKFQNSLKEVNSGFNPAEAEEGFSRSYFMKMLKS